MSSETSRLPAHAFTMADNVRRDREGLKQYQSHCTCGWNSEWHYERRASAYKLRRHIESEDWKSEQVIYGGERPHYGT